MKKLFLIFIFSPFFIFGQSAGNTGLSFLKFGFGARNIAMGDAGNSASNDLSALYYNPARLSSLEMNEAIFMLDNCIKMFKPGESTLRPKVYRLPSHYLF